MGEPSAAPPPMQNAESSSRKALAASLVRTTLALADAGLRACYIRSLAQTRDLASLAQALDMVCQGAEQAEAAAREVLQAIVDAFNAEGMDEFMQRLREQAAGESLLALERLVRFPLRPRRPSLAAAREAIIDRAGRPLTLGERKWLARRPDRDTMQRLLADPHPDVIRALLRNPRITEDDVVRLAARRPGQSTVLAEIARSTQWSHRPRVRISVVTNAATPPEIAARIAGLLLRPELELVVRSPDVPAAVRAVCMEHIARRPPLAYPDQQGYRLH